MGGKFSKYLARVYLSAYTRNMCARTRGDLRTRISTARNETAESARPSAVLAKIVAKNKRRNKLKGDVHQADRRRRRF